MTRIEQLIFEQADRRPEAVAVEYGHARLSYSELRRQSLRISGALDGLGFRPGGRAGIFADRSLETIPMLLGVWDAGGVVVPLNPETPPHVLEWLIADSSLRLVFTVKALKDKVEQAVRNIGRDSITIILIDGLPSDFDAEKGVFPLTDILRAEADGLPHGGAREDVCYVIYTSGSRGRPKGVIGTHASLAHYLTWQAREFSVGAGDRFSQVAPLSFDFSLKEILVPLICGARVCIADRKLVIDPEKFIEWVDEKGVTVMCCVPSLLRAILQAVPPSPGPHLFQSLREVLISGDVLRWEDVLNWRGRFGHRMSLVNLYGPTESTVIKLFYRIANAKRDDCKSVPVGKPIDGAEVLVVDEHDRPCPPGRAGEIVILSDWIARGYLNGDKLDNHSFTHLSHNGAPRRAYRTGDLGQVLDDGNIEFMGRRDRQVKIRGYRIELDEIESILAEHPRVEDVAVVASKTTAGTPTDDSKIIVCFYTAGKFALPEKELRGYAEGRLLPQVLSAMRFTPLPQMPLSANGKVDRLKLESITNPRETPGPDETLTAAPSTVKQSILSIWKELLALEQVDSEATFFELGGNSLLAISLLRRLREELHPQIKLDDVYQHASVSQLSTRIETLLNGSQ